MSATALFAASVDALKASLRLSGATHSDAVAVFEAELRSVRVAIYSRLGAARVTEVLATTLVDEPTTDAQIVRAAAADLETRLLLYRMRRRMPTIFLDASTTASRAWNDAPESPGRDPFDVENRALLREIEELYSTVAGSVDVGEASGINVGNVEPDEAPAPLGSGRYPGGDYGGP